MPYTAPTAAEFKARFPEFASVADATVDAHIAEATRWVDESWIEEDYQPAVRFLAAHQMASEGQLVAGGPAVGAVRGPLKSARLGDASESYGDRISGLSGTDAELATTAYGVAFLRLRRANHPAVKTTSTV